MAEEVILKAEVRTEHGSRHSRRLRREGKVPIIVYGHQQEPVAIAVNRHDFTVGLQHGHRVFDVSIDGKKHKLLTKDLQYDHLGKDIIHADMVRVSLTETVTVTVPLELKGTAKGTEEGGIVETPTDQIEIECRVTDIPESIPVSIRELEVGQSLHARDIQLPEGVKLISDPEMLVVLCHMVSVAKTTEELEEEMPAAPEVIGEEAEESEQAQPEKEESE